MIIRKGEHLFCFKYLRTGNKLTVVQELQIQQLVGVGFSHRSVTLIAH